ncbi:MAG: PCP reductase family protein [Nitrospirales bacterium]
MHSAGVEETVLPSGDEAWFVRWECLGCGGRVGLEVDPALGLRLVDRLCWTDEARHRLERMPPYVQSLVRPSAEDYARSKGRYVITDALLAEARCGGAIEWDPEAEGRLSRVPAPVRAMAKVELERTASERGQARVTVALMEEVKAKYFGLAASRLSGAVAGASDVRLEPTGRAGEAR